MPLVSIGIKMTTTSEDGFELQQWQQYVNGGSSPVQTHQQKLESRVRLKFSHPQNWTWTKKLLEQSSDEWVSRMIAGMFPRDAMVRDVCCGAGGDSVAIGLRGPVSALDAAMIACVLCESNLQNHHVKDFAVTNRVAESLIVGAEEWVHIDPDRRPSNLSHMSSFGSRTRTTNAQLFMPALDVVLRLISESCGGSVKVAPATLPDVGAFSNCKNGLDILHRMGKQFVSWGNSVRQQRWWWNLPKFPAGSTTVSTMRSKDDWYHWTFNSPGNASQENFGRICDVLPATALFIGDTDSAVRAAKGQLVLASERQCGILGSEQGYFFTDRVATGQTSTDRLIRWFEIEEVLPLDRKKIKQYLRARNVGTLEIKVRDAPVVPEVLRKELNITGEESRTMLICRCAKKVVAIIAKRVVAE